MSREIKFRVWSKKYNTYFELSDIHYEGGKIDGIFAISGILAGIPNVIFLEPEDVVLEQDTGLKDKNGKEICEGDRIKIEGSDSVYTVEYGRGVWVARFGDEPGDNICLHHYVQKDIVLYAEVIGNIHENPELLEKGE